MWCVTFNLEKQDTTGKVVRQWKIIESGFENQGQANAWYYGGGAARRFGAEFFGCVKGIEIAEFESVRLSQVEAPPFTSGAAIVVGAARIEDTQWYTREENDEKQVPKPGVKWEPEVSDD